MKKTIILMALVLALGVSFALAQQPGQQPETRPVTVMQPMPDFTLPALDGGQVTLSALRGRNVMIIFSRGYAAENAWCTICQYQYAELVMRELRDKVREKYDLEVLFVLPYDKDVVTKWRDIVPEQLEKIKKWKNPADPAALDETARRRLERYKMIFPLDIAPADIEAKPGEPARPFPVLMDADRALTKRLGVFATEWGGSKVDQGIPSVYIVDKAGTLRFKYIGQTTVDRPSYDYLFKILDCVGAGK
ncbi:MAG: redoxin domain-containing protein [Candidatus Aminicenantes bacterium]|nr:redoxin domain-containing protein [Candidatus Aminicenantes bacterium]